MSTPIVEIDDIWYPPVNILFHGDKKLREDISSDQRKQINEAMSAAIMLVGMNKRNGSSYRLQTVKAHEQTPDVRTMRLIDEGEKAPTMEFQDVEVVTLEKNSDEEVDDFLKRTKLSPRKSYPLTTVILCHMNKNVKKAKSWKQVYRSLKELNHPNEVFVLARVDPAKHKYQLAQVNPVIGIEEYDVEEELFSNPKQRVLKMESGSTSFLKPNGETHIPFE